CRITLSSIVRRISFAVAFPSLYFTSEDLFSSRMMSMHSSTHSSQMNPVGPAISLRTSCWLFPQNEQYSVFLESPPLLLILLMLFQPFRPCPRQRGARTLRACIHGGNAPLPMPTVS